MGQRQNIIIIASVLLLISVLIFFLIIFFMCKKYKQKTGGRRYLSDRIKYRQSYFQLLDFFRSAEPYRLNINSLPVINWLEADGVILGKIGDRLVYRPTDTDGNLAVFALPGSGKTTSQIIPSCLRFGGSVLAIDIKGDILNFTRDKRKIKIFNPENPEISCHYDPLAGIAELSDIDRRNEIELLSSIILPDDGSQDGRFFCSGGRDYFCGISLYLLSQNKKTTLPDIAKAIVAGNAFSWATEIDSSNCDIAKSFTSSYIGSNEKNIAGIYNTIVKAVRPFAFGSLAFLLDGSDDCITTKSLDSGYDVYLEIPQDKIKLYAPVMTIITQQLLSSFMRRPDKATGKQSRPVLFLLDEFPQLQFDYSILSAALSTLRSKSVSLFLACQSLSQLRERYGQEGTRSIIDTCAYISVMSAQDADSRDYFSRICGTRKTLQIGTTAGTGTTGQSTNIITEPVFSPADFANLGNDVIIVANGKYVRGEKTYCFQK